MADFSETDSRLTRVHGILEDIASSISLLSEAKREAGPRGPGDEEEDYETGQTRHSGSRGGKQKKAPAWYASLQKKLSKQKRTSTSKSSKEDKKSSKKSRKELEDIPDAAERLTALGRKVRERHEKAKTLGAPVFTTKRKVGSVGGEDQTRETGEGARTFRGSFRQMRVAPGEDSPRATGSARLVRKPQDPATPARWEPTQAPVEKFKLLKKKWAAGGPQTGSGPPVPSARDAKARILHDIRRMHRQTIQRHARPRHYGPLPSTGTEPHRGALHARYWRDNQDDEETPTHIRHPDHKHGDTQASHAHGYHVDRKSGKVVHSSGKHHEFANKTTFKPTSDDAMLHTDNSKSGARGSADQSEFLIKGHDVAKNPLHKWFRMSKQGGLPSAMATLGAAYHDGGDVKKRAMAVARTLSFPGADGSMVKVRPTGDLHNHRKICMKGRNNRLHPAAIRLKKHNPSEYYRLCKGAHGPSGTPDRDEYHRGFNPKHAHIAKLHQLHVAALKGKASKPTQTLIGRHGTNAQRAAEAAGRAGKKLPAGRPGHIAPKTPIAITARSQRRRDMRKAIGSQIDQAARSSSHPNVLAASAERRIGSPAVHPGDEHRPETTRNMSRRWNRGEARPSSKLPSERAAATAAQNRAAPIPQSHRLQAALAKFKSRRGTP